MAANRGCERDVTHRMNQGCRTWGHWRALKSVQEQLRIGDKDQEVSMWRRNKLYQYRCTEQRQGVCEVRRK